jgi:hypothetical protein
MSDQKPTQEKGGKHDLEKSVVSSRKNNRAAPFQGQ